MIKKISDSLAYRLPVIYRYLLKFIPVKINLKKEKSDAVVLMMTGKNHLDMTRLAVLSIARTWLTLPKLIITTDGSISPGHIAKTLNFWPAELIVEPWQTTADYHLRKNRQALIVYGEAHPFGKKMAVILRHAEQQPVVWVDSDILFFKDFVNYIPQKVTGFACGGLEDFRGAYHSEVSKFFNNNLYELINLNAGLLFVSGENIYEDFKLEQLLSEIHPKYDFCTEQSIFAHIANTSMGLLWSKDLVKNLDNDDQQLKPMPRHNITARHYTSNIRHLFWRDAFYNL